MIEEHGIHSKRSQGLVDAAYLFANNAHGDQKRKYTGEPYITHPVAVAQLVANITDDCNLICAALLHDVIEDTDVTYDELMKLEHGFGFPIVDLVMDLTDVSHAGDGNRATRKKIDREHTEQAAVGAKTVKLADLIHNSVSILEHDKRFAKVYMEEKRLLLDVLTEGHPYLYEMAKCQIDCYYAKETNQ